MFIIISKEKKNLVKKAKTTTKKQSYSEHSSNFLCMYLAVGLYEMVKKAKYKRLLFFPFFVYEVAVYLFIYFWPV